MKTKTMKKMEAEHAVHEPLQNHIRLGILGGFNHERDVLLGHALAHAAHTWTTIGWRLTAISECTNQYPYYCNIRPKLPNCIAAPRWHSSGAAAGVGTGIKV